MNIWTNVNMDEIQKIKNALSYIDPDVSYSEWLSIGMALHSWDEDIGFIEWDLWSKNGSKYEWRYIKDKWNSFRSNGGITLNTLFHMAKENGWNKEGEDEETMQNTYDPSQICDPSVLPFIALTKRKISAEVCRLYGVHTSVMEADGKTLDKSYFPYKKNGVVTGYHVRNHNPKDKRDKINADIGTGSGNLDLFGKEVASRSRRKRIFITEGRIDCLSLAETFKEHTKKDFKGFDGIVSINNGSSSALKDCLNNREFIESFQEVILVFDADEDGRKAASKVLKSFPRFKVAKLPEGLDCNEMRLQGRDKELYDLVMWKAENVRQGESIKIDDKFIEKALEKPKMGLSTPWPSVDKKIFGIRPHTIWIVGAAPKIGKSEHKNQLIQHLSFYHKRPVGVYDLEVHPVITAKQIISKHIGVNLIRPDADYNNEDLINSLKELSKTGIMFYDRGASREWSDIRICIEEQHILDGVCEFFLDPLTALISRYTAAEANDKLNEIMTDAADLVFKYPITLFMYSHVNNKPKGSLPHERGGKVLSSEFTGSRALEKWSHFGFGISRNRSDDCEPENENFSEISLLYSREPVTGYKLSRLYYDNETTKYLEE